MFQRHEVGPYKMVEDIKEQAFQWVQNRTRAVNINGEYSKELGRQLAMSCFVTVMFFFCFFVFCFFFFLMCML
ncbi:hypothetical protein HanXRQr2_Chr09g0391231 [Helianthus annuus]|uniref:Uncharacterized protein n=1 Tax=Helianthus annuus TaxID=4232 RepID=A0A9K3N8I7_HELAN|nr:hypothetical protein HanXRQr2_Chr09g0391231 [Helianthus annuus]